MAITARATRPAVLVIGAVESVEPRIKRDTGVVFRTDVALRTPSGGVATVEYWERPDQPAPELPALAQNVAVLAEVSESAQYGASLGFLRYPNPGDLDLVASTLSLYASSK